MNTMQLICFLTVAETLNFARAAERLHVTQPAVTQQIHTLEAELSTQLFRRTTRTVELTREGLIFLGDAKAMVEIYGRAKKRAESAVTDTRESFLIGCHSSNDILLLSHTLQAVREQLPHLYPVFRVVPFQHLYQRLSEEAVDVIVAFREGGLKKTIRYQELTKVPIVGITKGGAFFAQKKELRLCDLRQNALIALDPQKCPEDYRSLLNRVLEDHSPVDVYFCETVEAAVALALAGYGAAMLPDFFENRHPSLCYLPVTDAPLLSYGVYFKSSPGPSLRKTFVKLARETFSAPQLSMPGSDPEGDLSKNPRGILPPAPNPS